MACASQTCLVCQHVLTGSVCPNCGADDVYVQRLLREEGAKPVKVPRLSFWRALVGRPLLPASSLGEDTWSALSDDFKEATLRDFARLRRRAAVHTNLVLALMTLAILAAGFAAGVRVGGQIEAVQTHFALWVCGVAGQFISCCLIAFPLGVFIEKWLHHARAETKASQYLDNTSFIGTAVLRRCPLPCYLNPNVLFPAIVAVVPIAGWCLV